MSTTKTDENVFINTLGRKPKPEAHQPKESRAKKEPLGIANALRKPVEPTKESKRRITMERQRKMLQMLNPENYLKVGFILENLPFLLFLVGLAMVYIGNTHFAFKKVRMANKLETELVELHDEYTAYKSELMGRSRMSNVAAALSTSGVKELKTAPEKIFLAKPNSKQSQ